MTEEQWMKLLRQACERTSQSRVAEQLGVSPALVNQVLGGRYKHPVRHLEERVKGKLMGHCVECPILGELNRRECIEYQTRTGVCVTNPVRVAIYRACRGGCPNFLEENS